MLIWVMFSTIRKHQGISNYLRPETDIVTLYSTVQIEISHVLNLLCRWLFSKPIATLQLHFGHLCFDLNFTTQIWLRQPQSTMNFIPTGQKLKYD